MKDEILPAPMKLLTTHKSDDDAILMHLQGKLERTDLSDKVQEQVDHMLECEKLIRKYVSRSKVVPMIQKLFDISWATGSRVYDRTQRLFGESSIKNQQFWADHALEGVVEDIRLARIAKDWRSVASLRKIQVDIIEKLMGSGDAALYDNIQPPTVVIAFMPGSMKVDKLPSDKELKGLISEKLKSISEDVEGYE
jgi:hypothetical protein